MTEQTMTEATTHTLEVPGAVLTYDVRPGTGDGPVLLLIGSPMGAAGFGTLAGYFPTARSSPTTRGASSAAAAPTAPRPRRPRSTPTTSRGSSRPRLRTRSTSSPAAAARSTPSRSWPATRSRCGRSSRTSRRWPRWCPTASSRSPPAATSTTPTSAAAWARPWPSSSPSSATRARSRPSTSTSRHPDPAMFGLPAEDDGSRDDVLLGQNLLSCTSFEPDIDALRAASTRDRRGGRRGVRRRAGQPRRARRRRAARDDAGRCSPPTTAGSSGGEYGQTGQPEPFAARLREVLAGRG